MAIIHSRRVAGDALRPKVYGLGYESVLEVLQAAMSGLERGWTFVLLDREKSITK
jgi:hypothetical protein